MARMERGESRRIDNRCLRTARLMPPKTLDSYDFSFQPSLDRERIEALASLEFMNRKEAVHFLGPPGTGKSHLACALGVAAVKAGKSVYRTTLAELVDSLAEAESGGRLTTKMSFYTRTILLWSWTKSDTCQSPPAASAYSSSWSAHDTKKAPWCSPPTAASPNGAKCSATGWWPPHCSTDCCTMPL